MLIAASGVAGSAFGASAIACAAPKFDSGFYGVCTEQKQRLYEKGKITKQQRDAAFKECCDLAGGTATYDKLVEGYICHQKAEAPRAVPGDVPTQDLTPDPPVAPPDATLVPTP